VTPEQIAKTYQKRITFAWILKNNNYKLSQCSWCRKESGSRLLNRRRRSRSRAINGAYKWIALIAQFLCLTFLRPGFADRTSNLSKAHKTRDSFSSSCSQVVLVYLQLCRRSLFLLCASQPKIAKKPTKLPISGLQRHLRSSTLIPLRSSSQVLVMIVAYLCLSATVYALDKPMAVK